jgi:hypothetical protein
MKRAEYLTLIDGNAFMTLPELQKMFVSFIFIDKHDLCRSIEDAAHLRQIDGELRLDNNRRILKVDISHTGLEHIPKMRTVARDMLMTITLCVV